MQGQLIALMTIKGQYTTRSVFNVWDSKVDNKMENTNYHTVGTRSVNKCWWSISLISLISLPCKHNYILLKQVYHS